MYLSYYLIVSIAIGLFFLIIYCFIILFVVRKHNKILTENWEIHKTQNHQNDQFLKLIENIQSRSVEKFKEHEKQIIELHQKLNEYARNASQKI